MIEVGLSLSGGGYRAAMFHLGTLDYMRRLKYSDGHSFLDDVNTISTISGGSITGLWYIMNCFKGVDIENSIKELYRLLLTVDLPSEAIQELTEGGDEKLSLIRIMADLYDKYFFHGETFDLLLKNIDSHHIHHFSANGTDFGCGLPFRFQASRKIENIEPQFSRGFIGNKIHRLDWNIAGQIRLAEILAVSSCFPGGFEPMRFPYDFNFSTDQENQTFVLNSDSFVLMDGGIVDNQGIEPLLLANKQLCYNHPDKEGKTDYAYHDLLVISDVSSPIIPKCQIHQPGCMHKVSLNMINKVLILFIVLFFSLLCLSTYLKSAFFIGVCLTWVVVFIVLKCMITSIVKSLLNLFKSAPCQIDFDTIKHISFYKWRILLLSRLESLMQLATSIFMKPIRQMRYNAVYNNKIWEHRTISNNLSELSSNGSWRWKTNLSAYLGPSKEMKENSDKACGFGTTLWFTDEDKSEGIPEALFCAGQYTFCMNLLEYIEKIKKDKINLGEAHNRIISLEEVLAKDWELFKKDPHVYHL